jgi:hypothetical protein
LSWVGWRLCHSFAQISVGKCILVNFSMHLCLWPAKYACTKTCGKCELKSLILGFGVHIYLFCSNVGGRIMNLSTANTCTKFFHANAIIKYRWNLITQLQDENGSLLANHHDKEFLLW